MVNYNAIILHFVVFNKFQYFGNKSSIDIVILNNSKYKNNLNIKYSDLLKIIEPYGFTRKYIFFDNIKDDDILNVRISGVSAKKMISFLQEVLPLITAQNHILNIIYAFKENLYNNGVNVDNIDYRQYFNSYIKQNLNNYSVLKFKSYKWMKPKDLLIEGEIEEETFFDDKYMLYHKEQCIFCIHSSNGYFNNLHTLIMKVWINNILTVNHSTDKPELIKYFRNLKLKNIFSDENSIV